MDEKKKDIVEEVREEVEKELKERKPMEIPFFNATNLRFVDINHELFRQYLYTNGANITINFPLKLSIDIKGVHRVFDASGLSYFIPPNWIAVVTKPKPGAPNFIM